MILLYLTLSNYVLVWGLILTPTLCYLIWDSFFNRHRLKIATKPSTPPKKHHYRTIFKIGNCLMIGISILGVSSALLRGSIGMGTVHMTHHHQYQQTNQLIQSQHFQSYLNQQAKLPLSSFEHHWYQSLAQQQAQIVKDNQNLKI